MPCGQINIPEVDNTLPPCPDGYIEAGCVIVGEAIPIVGIVPTDSILVALQKMAAMLKQQQIEITLLKNQVNGQ